VRAARNDICEWTDRHDDTNRSKRSLQICGRDLLTKICTDFVKLYYTVMVSN
jgi:hypothetical protein